MRLDLITDEASHVPDARVGRQSAGVLPDSGLSGGRVRVGGAEVPAVGVKPETDDAHWGIDPQQLLVVWVPVDGRRFGPDTGQVA